VVFLSIADISIPFVAYFAVELVQLAVLLMGAYRKGVLNALGSSILMNAHVEFEKLLRAKNGVADSAANNG